LLGSRPSDALAVLGSDATDRSPTLLQARAEAYLQLGDRDKALAALERAFDLEPVASFAGHALYVHALVAADEPAAVAARLGAADAPLHDVRARVALLCALDRAAEARSLLARLPPFDAQGLAILVASAAETDALRADLDARTAAFIGAAARSGKRAHPYHVGIYAGSRAVQGDRAPLAALLASAKRATNVT